MDDPPRSVDDALSIALAIAGRLAEGRPLARMPVVQALDRVLHVPVRAAGDVPPFACSAMDGYAISAGPAGRCLRVIGEARAGAPASLGLDHHETAIRISTGAAVPAGATAVLRQEDARPGPEPGTIETLAGSPPAANIRLAGEDLVTGDEILAAGCRLGVAELGAAVAAGVAELTVSARPRVSVLCTGDELRAPGEALGPGQIHNSNAVLLAALAERAGAEVLRSGRVPDDPAATERVLSEELETAEVLLVSGGVSVGPHDYVRPALASLGARELLWRVALRPGGPLWLGSAGDALIFGLPGNPVSAVVTCVLFALPAIRALQGDKAPAPRSAARLTTAVRPDAERELAIRVRLITGPDGVEATPTGSQGSHIVTSLLGAEALAMVPPGRGELPAGTAVPLVPLPR